LIKPGTKAISFDGSTITLNQDPAILKPENLLHFVNSEEKIVFAIKYKTIELNRGRLPSSRLDIRILSKSPPDSLGGKFDVRKYYLKLMSKLNSTPQDSGDESGDGMEIGFYKINIYRHGRIIDIVAIFNIVWPNLI